MFVLNYFLKNKLTDDLFNVCSFLLDSLKIKYTNLHLKKLLEDHLNPSSLLAVKDTLSSYGIESGAIRKEGHSYEDFELPIICSIQEEDWPVPAFTIVTNVNQDKIDYLDPSTNKIKTTTINRFQSIDKGVVMLLDSAESINEHDLRKNLSKERSQLFLSNLPLALAFISLFSCGGYIIANFKPGHSWFNLGYLLTTCLGFLTSLLLIWHEIDKDNKLIKQVCGKGGKKVNCDAVLSSPQSSFFGISWSIWGGAYFCMLFLVQLLFVNDYSFLLVTASLSLLIVPYVFYSIYLQWRIIKQWCPLCLGIQALLIINAMIAWNIFQRHLGVYEHYNFQSYPFLITLLIGAFTFFLISASVPMLKSVRDSKTYQRNLRLFKSDKNVFKYFLNKSESVTEPADSLGIVIGNPAASNEIIKVCNPYCGPCSDMHPKLGHLLKNNPDVKLRIIFTASGEEHDEKRKPVIHFLAIQQKFGNELAHSAIDNWYGAIHKDYEVFASRFIVDNELKEQNDKVLAMSRWCDSMKIRVTPTLFVNGYEFPPEYSVEDLQNIL